MVKAKKNKKTAQPQDDTPQRTVIYPDRDASICDGEYALVVEKTQELLGWCEDAAEASRAGFTEPLFVYEGRKIWCLNNMSNRPLYWSSVEKYAQEHLRRRWRFNGESVIIGKTGIILNGQHRLISHWLAEQIRNGKQASYWASYWDTPVTMECLIVFGVDEEDAVVNTMDTCKPRSLADVVFRSPYFGQMKTKDRVQVSRMVDNALRMMWHRTWLNKDSFAPQRTHAEALDWLARHPRLLEAVAHVYQENQNGAIRQYLPAGYASAMMYLMAADETDGDVYHNSDPPSENVMDFQMWNRACEFWVALAKCTPAMLPVRNQIVSLRDPSGNGAGGSLDEVMGILCKAWGLYRGGDEITEDAIALTYDEKDGDRYLDEYPVLGGIDKGKPRTERASKTDADPDGGKPALARDHGQAVSPEEEVEGEPEGVEPDADPEATVEDGPAPGDPTPEEIAELAEQQRLAREEAERPVQGPESTPKAKRGKKATNGQAQPTRPLLMDVVVPGAEDNGDAPAKPARRKPVVRKS